MKRLPIRILVITAILLLLAAGMFFIIHSIDKTGSLSP